MCSNAKTFLAFSPQEDWVRTRSIASDSPLGVKFWRLIFILLYCSACVYIYTICSYFIPIVCLVNYIHRLLHHCHVNTCHHTLCIQSECFVQPFTDEGGYILTETSELLLKVG